MPVIKHELAPDLTIYEGHVIEGLQQIPDKTVQCVVTSDPYWGLRDYGMAPVDWPEVAYSPMPGLAPVTVPAWKGSYGLEPTPEMYVGHSVLIRRELWRVMRDDGVQWLNLGDTYCTVPHGSLGVNTIDPKAPEHRVRTGTQANRRPLPGLKHKDLVGIPWRVAFALQADGWYLRSDIIWNKPNPMPESVTDRPTKAHEYIFLLSKSPHYFYDADAIREPQVKGAAGSTFTDGKTGVNGMGRVSQLPREDNPAGRNKRSVWTISTTPFPEAHFATFPEELPGPCILAGTSPKACPKCGAPWDRMFEKEPTRDTHPTPEGPKDHSLYRGHRSKGSHNQTGTAVTTVGWQPTCSCEGNDGTGKCVVLDPFGGSMTTVRVALEHGRAGVACELNPEYIEMGIRARLDKTQTSLLGQM